MSERQERRRGRAGQRWGLAFIVAAFGILGAIHSVVVPLFETPDEVWHFSFIQRLATTKSLPVQRTDGTDLWLREAGQPPLYHMVASAVVAPLDTSDFPDFVRFNVAHPAVTASSRSDAPNVFIHTHHEAFPYRGAVLAIHLVRLLTVLWGAGTIVGVYLVAREVVPERLGLALAAAAVAAFNPHLLFISGAVNNDAAAVCLCTLTLWSTIRLSQGRTDRRSTLALGLFLGLALLSKLSALALLPLVALALGLRWRREQDTRALLTRGAIVYSLAVLIAGWWYLRNWVLYDDPLAWGVWLEHAGVDPLGLVELWGQLGRVAVLFWSPYEGLFPASVLWALGALHVPAALGWVRVVRTRAWTAVNRTGLLLAAVWFALLVVSLLRFMTITPAATGRLLFPGIAAFATLFVVGLSNLVPRRRTGLALGAVGTGLLALSVASPLLAIAPLFAPPLVSRAEVAGSLPLSDAVFGDVRLLGIEVSPDEIQAGDVVADTVAVTLYWEAQDTPRADLRAVVRLWTLGGRLVGQQDTQPAAQSYPPDLWRGGDIVRDTYRLRVVEPGPAMCRVAVSVRAGDRLLGRASTSLVFKLAPPPISPEQISHPTAYTLGNQVALAGYDLSLDGAPPDENLAVTLYWHPLIEMSEDYTVFVHLLAEDGTLLGQGDGPPLGKDYPTSYWRPGKRLADTHLVPLDEGLPPGAYLLVGLYHRSTGTRLPVLDAAGERVPDDAIKLDPE